MPLPPTLLAYFINLVFIIRWNENTNFDLLDFRCILYFVCGFFLVCLHTWFFSCYNNVLWDKMLCTSSSYMRSRCSFWILPVFSIIAKVWIIITSFVFRVNEKMAWSVDVDTCVAVSLSTATWMAFSELEKFLALTIMFIFELFNPSAER